MQATNHILLIRPASFLFNKETAGSNAFQKDVDESEEEIKRKKLTEFDGVVQTLKGKGVSVLVVNDTDEPQKPDAIFPNNWVSFHEGGTVVLYPMCAPNRRTERRLDIIDLLKKHFEITTIKDLSHFEQEGRFLEGTGSVLFDHLHKIAYACLSPRTDKELFISLCDYLHYKPVYFTAIDDNGKEIYHTNVMMCVGEQFTVVCLDTIKDDGEKQYVVQSLTETGHTIIDITPQQMKSFAGNMLSLKTNKGESILVLSQSAFDSLTPVQKKEIEKYSALVPLSINTIETMGGGSARCMIAEIFLKPIAP